MIAALKRRKSLFVKDRGIITYGTVTPEQAFITYSSVCFSAYVKYFADHYYARGAGGTGDLAAQALRSYRDYLIRESANWSLPEGPYHDRGDTDAIASAGRLTVGLRLVDSFFGNISYRTDNEIYISQTGSSLDELPGFIDRCPMDGSSCAGVTASSEFSAHKEVYLRTDNRAILHGHPKFSVIMSMLCDKENCANRGLCYKACSEARRIGDIPVVPERSGGPVRPVQHDPGRRHGQPRRVSLRARPFHRLKGRLPRGVRTAPRYRTDVYWRIRKTAVR
jgi:hypothetical protein